MAMLDACSLVRRSGADGPATKAGPRTALQEKVALVPNSVVTWS